MRCRQREAVDIERLAHAVEQVGHFRLHQSIANPQAGQAIGFGEGARNDQVVLPFQPARTVEAQFRRQVFVVGLIQHHNDVPGHLGQKRVDVGRCQERAGRVIRVGDEDQARLRSDGR